MDSPPAHQYSTTQLLYHDGPPLHIQSFSRSLLSELQSALCSCRYWQDAEYADAGRSDTIYLTGHSVNFTARLMTAVVSPLARHATAIFDESIR